MTTGISLGPVVSGLLLEHFWWGAVFLINLPTMLLLLALVPFLVPEFRSAKRERFDLLSSVLWSLVPAAGVAVMAPAGAALAQRMDRAYVMGGGFLLSACGFLWLTQVRTDSALWFTLAGASLYAGGLVAAMTLANELALGAAPPEHAGSAAAVLESGQELGGALGMALLGSIGAAVYSRDMAGALPSGVPQAEAVRETLGGATAAAAQLPEETADAVLATARDAFTHGMSFAAVCAALVMAGAALFAFTRLRASGSGQDKEPSHGTVRDSAL